MEMFLQFIFICVTFNKWEGIQDGCSFNKSGFMPIYGKVK